MKKIILIFIITFTFLLGVYIGYFYFPKYFHGKELVSENQNIKISLIIEYDQNNKESFFDLKAMTTDTIFDVLKKVCDDNKINLLYKDYGGGMGVLVSQISDFQNNFDEGVYWQYWVNDSYSEMGASLKKVNDGDVILWKLDKGNY